MQVSFNYIGRVTYTTGGQNGREGTKLNTLFILLMMTVLIKLDSKQNHPIVICSVITFGISYLHLHQMSITTKKYTKSQNENILNRWLLNCGSPVLSC
jgi:hypothetical protein